MRIGSDAHKELFCRWFINTHRAYEPEDLPWPELDDASIARLRCDIEPLRHSIGSIRVGRAFK